MGKKLFTSILFPIHINFIPKTLLFSWLVGSIEFNATLTAKVISWWLVMHMCFLAFSHQYYCIFSFQSHQLFFSYASAEVRGKNTPERKVASTGYRNHNHQVMSPTLSPLSHPGWALLFRIKINRIGL